ncbi:hypothetical protein F4825DRAFT_202922 [Nemania diffusa]|nr:hypothetical protein F4825DRAFT_202922 [Nemania diffusa]
MNTNVLFILISQKGGTHMDSTASLQGLIVVKESGIAKGTRHIAAFIGERAREAQRETQRLAETVS